MKTKPKKSPAALIGKFAILFLPLLLWEIVEVTVLPPDQFTFRAWEALLIHRVTTLPGPFYPLCKSEKWSAGDHSPRVVTKFVRFETDEYGYRNPPYKFKDRSPDIVLVGDSNIAGCHLDEPETLSAMLESTGNYTVYNMGSGLPNNLLGFFSDRRWLERPPKILLFQVHRENFTTGILPIIPNFSDRKSHYTMAEALGEEDSLKNKVLRNLPLGTQVVVDRLSKQGFYHFLQSRLMPGRLHEPASNPSRQVLYSQQVSDTRDRLREYERLAHARNMEFILFVMPGFDRGFDGMLKRLIAEGMNVIAFFPTPSQPHGVHPSTWNHNEDSHWRPESVAVSAQLIAQMIHEKNLLHSKFNKAKPQESIGSRR